MRRREFIGLALGTAASWPLMTRAQQPTMPVIGFVNAASPKNYPRQLAAFRLGLKEAGYVEGQNVAIKYRWAEDRHDRLPAMVAELVHDRVAVIAATTTPAALAAKAATATIPIVFTTAVNPVRLSLVESLNRPGGNVTGVTETNVEITPKRLQLLHELLPSASVMALLVNKANPTLSETQSDEVLSAAHKLGVDLHVLNASTASDFDGVFTRLKELHAGGLVIAGDPLFTSQSDHLAALTVQHAVPAIYQFREFATAGGVLSYGADVTDAYRLAGNYIGRILKGDKPADLPVQQVSKVELYLNLRTARALGLNVPNALVGRADEVIE